MPTKSDGNWSLLELRDLSPETTLQELPLWSSQLELNSSGNKAFEMFQRNPLLPGLLLTEQQEYQGMISRRQFFERMSRPFALEIFSKRPLQVLYGFITSDVLVLPQNMPVVDAVKQALERSLDLVYEPIVVQTETTYALLDVHQLLLAYSNLYSLAATALQDTEIKAIEQENKLKTALDNQTRLIQTEKMSSLGQLVAGIAHEINNPINFVSGNIVYASNYVTHLLELVQLYQQQFPDASPEIQSRTEEIDLDFLLEDLPKVLLSMKIGTERIQDLIRSLRNFSRLDEAAMKRVDIHEGLESTLLLLRGRLKGISNAFDIQVIRDYGQLPLVECHASQLNQVFMNLLINAIDALEAHNDQRSAEEIRSNPSLITIRTQPINSETIAIQITDNGVGMSETVRQRLFDPFFTTKPIGKGTGLGLSISYQIVTEKHQGTIQCISELGQGTTFWIEIPVQQRRANLAHPTA
ncbi:MAG TPA: ATP-binding protein [Coleofasciculaceae cyanobacterium]